MTEDPNYQTLEHLHAICIDLRVVREDLHDVKRRLTSLEASVASLLGDFVDQSGRIDRVESRLGRIEDCLELRAF